MVSFNMCFNDTCYGCDCYEVIYWLNTDTFLLCLIVVCVSGLDFIEQRKGKCMKSNSRSP